LKYWGRFEIAGVCSTPEQRETTGGEKVLVKENER